MGWRRTDPRGRTASCIDPGSSANGRPASYTAGARTGMQLTPAKCHALLTHQKYDTRPQAHRRRDQRRRPCLDWDIPLAEIRVHNSSVSPAPRDQLARVVRLPVCVFFACGTSGSKLARRDRSRAPPVRTALTPASGYRFHSRSTRPQKLGQWWDRVNRITIVCPGALVWPGTRVHGSRS